MAEAKSTSGDNTLTLSGIHKLISGLALIAIVSGATVTVRNMATLMVMDNRMANIEEKVSTQIDDRYRAAQAAADFKLRDNKIAELEKRLREIDGRVHKHHDLGGHQVMERRMDGVERELERLKSK